VILLIACNMKNNQCNVMSRTRVGTRVEDEMKSGWVNHAVHDVGRAQRLDADFTRLEFG